MDRTALPRFSPGQRRLSAHSLNALVDLTKSLDRAARVPPELRARPPQRLIEAQETIAAGAKGEVKFAYWDDDAAALASTGDAFDAVNIGPSSIANGDHALVTLGEGPIPAFQFTAAPAGPGMGMLGIGDFKLSVRQSSYTDDDGAVWQICDGSGVSQSTYSDFDALLAGLTPARPWGSGGGNVNVPDFRDRFIVMPGYEVTLGDDDGLADDGSRSPLSHTHAHTIATASAGGHGHAVTGDIAGDKANIQDHGEQATSAGTAHKHSTTSGLENTLQAGSDLEIALESSHTHDTPVMGHSQDNHNHGGSITNGAAMAVGGHTHTLSGSITAKDSWPAYGTGNWFVRIA